MKRLIVLVSFALAMGLAAFGAQEFRVPQGEKFGVKGGELVDITFRARVTKGASIENCPLYSSLITLAACNFSALPAGGRLPRVDVCFYRADGKSAYTTWLCQGAVTVWSSDWRSYRHSVFAPADAVTAQVSVARMEPTNAVEVADLKVVHRDPFKEPTRNINPFFDYGLFNGSGYSFMGATRWRVTPEGRNWFDLAQGSCYPDAFPVKGGEKLEIRFHGDSPTWLHCYVCFYPKYTDVGNLNMNKKFFVLDVHNKSHHPERIEKVDVPPDATWARVYIQSTGKIEDFRVIPVGKEGK